jgi:molybdopterin-guanine dinucleotide biosynthesis protein A
LNTDAPAISVIILAGGGSKRFGRDKTTVRLGHETLLERAIRRLAPLGKETILVRGAGQAGSLQSQITSTKEARDKHKGKGPLAGIHAGLLTSSTHYNIVVACDMPFLSLPLLRYMTSAAAGFDVVMPCIQGKTEALHAIYARSCIASIEALLKQQGQPRIIQFLNAVKVRYIDEAEIDRFDKAHISFFNINTLEDFERAERLLQQFEL